MNKSNLVLKLSILTVVLTALVYIDIMYLFGAFFITIPLAVIAAVITIIYALINKQFIFALLNLVLAFIAIISFFVFPW